MIFCIMMISIIVMGGGRQPEKIEDKYRQDKFISLRAILAMMIIFGHMWPNNSYGNKIIDHLIAPFNNTGYLDTAVFFFLSGFGTYESSKNRENYFKNYFRNKTIKVLVPYWIINCFYIFFAWAATNTLNFKDGLISFIWPIYNGAAWYVFAVLIVYLFLYILLNVFHLTGKKLYTIYFTILCAYIVVYYFLKIGSWWYVSVLASLIGLIFSDYKKMFSEIFSNPIPIFIFLILYFGLVWNMDTLPNAIIILLKLFTAVLSPLIICGLMKKHRVETKCLDYIGKSSYEIYLVQGLFVLYFKINLVNTIVSREITALFGVVFSVIAGCLLHKVIVYTTKRLKTI